MTKLEMLQEALKELDEPSAEEIAEFFHARYRVTLSPRLVPILRASLVEKAMLDRVRRQAMAATEARGRQTSPEARGSAVAGCVHWTGLMLRSLPDTDN